MLSSWRLKYSLPPSLPLSAFGASSGGSFVSLLAHLPQPEARAHSLVVHIASGAKQALQTAVKGVGGYPPTLFVHMPRDRATAGRVLRAVAVLRGQGGEADELRCGEKRMDEGFFARRIPGLKAAESAELFRALREEGIIGEDGRMTTDGRRTSWREAVDRYTDRHRDSKLDDWSKFEDGIEEEMNVAYAFHEMSAEFAEEWMDWIQGICRRKKVGGSEVVTIQGRCKYSDGGEQ